MQLASHLVAGCDLWLNLPRLPFEASGTSGMKAALNGGLNLSVLDGWWPEAFDGSHGWAVEGAESRGSEAQDSRHANAVANILEREVVPLCFDPDADGIPRGWAEPIKASLRSVGLRFSARRMLADFVTKAYRAGPGADRAAS